MKTNFQPNKREKKMTKGNLEIKFFRPKNKKVREMAAQFEKVVRKSFF